MVPGDRRHGVRRTAYAGHQDWGGFGDYWTWSLGVEHHVQALGLTGAYVGARYAYGKGHGPIWLFIDELGDVVTPEFVSLLNKSRGEFAYTLIDTDGAVDSAVVDKIRAISGVLAARVI